LRKCRVELADVVQSAVEASKPFIDESGQELSVAIPDSPIYLDADPHRLAQVLSNLLNNAAKYTPEGDNIWLAAERQGSDVVLSVRDDGLGIPAEMLDRIFEMFAQIERPMEKGYTGLGIGLTLVKSLVEMHGGRIEVHSDGPGCGSTFIVRLPVLVETPDRDRQPVRPGEENTPHTKRRVLVVDDNGAAAKLLGMVVRMLGHEVRTASDGRQGVELAAEYLPDVVLMDLGMPRMNGYEAAQHIRRQPWGERMMLVALTGWGQEEDKKRTKEAGFDRHLVKPAEPSELQALFAELDGKAVM
jgi:CheY-like chemotaxis protein